MAEADPIQQNEFRQRVDKDVAAQRLAAATNPRGAPARSAVLELNQSLREAKQQMGHLPDGSLMMQIPEFDFYVLLRRFPDLNSTDPATNKAAWEKFFKSSYAAPYRVRRNDGRQRAPR